MDVARFHLLGKLEGPVEVFGENCGAETIVGVVGHGDGLIDIVDPADAESWTENLVAGDLHLGCYIG